MPRIVLWLVHGTNLWRRSRWPRPGSLFRHALNEKLPRECEYEAFEWSGSNTHSARVTAGEDLARVLRKAIAEDPTAAHYVIAHSHGGNVLMYALRALSSVPTQLIGASTLGTPFIRVVRRAVPRRVRLISTVVAILAVIMLVRTVNRLLTPVGVALAGLVHGPGSALAMVIGVAGTMVATMYFLTRRLESRLGPWLVRHGYRLQDTVVRKLRFGRYHDLSLLCIRTAGDEAGIGITVGRSMSEAWHLPWHRATTKPAFAIWLLDWAIVTLWVGVRLVQSHFQWRIPLGQVFVAMAWPAALIIGSMLVSVIAGPLWGLPRWPTFGEGIMTSLFADVRIARRPWPQCKAEKLVSDPWTLRRAHGFAIAREYGFGALLSHSLLYSDPAVIAGIASHIRRCDELAASPLKTSTSGKPLQTT